MKFTRYTASLITVALVLTCVSLPSNASAATSCVTLTTNLGIGARDTESNGEVSKLQTFLAAQGSSVYPEGTVSGFFGMATWNAVGRYQLQKGIVSGSAAPGYGYIGARTRASISKGCGPTFSYAPKTITVDAVSLMATSSHPMITGTATVGEVAMVINNAAGVGIYGTWHIPVVNGHWTNAVAQSLAPGHYTIDFAGAEKIFSKPLEVSY